MSEKMREAKYAALSAAVKLAHEIGGQQKERPDAQMVANWIAVAICEKLIAPLGDLSRSTAAPTADDAERAYVQKSEEVFFNRILRAVESNEIPGMEPWNITNAADLLRRMKASDGLSASQAAEVAALKGELLAVRDVLDDIRSWAKRRCPCENEQPDPCPLCGVSVDSLEGCRAVPSTFPKHIDIDRALISTAERAAAIEREWRADERRRVDHAIDHCEPAFIAELANERETWIEAATALARLSAPVTDDEVEAMAKIIFDSAVGLTQWGNEFYAEEKQGCRTAARDAITAHRAGRGMA